MNDQTRYSTDYSQPERNFVRALPDRAKPAVAYPVNEHAPTVVVERVFDAQDGAQERTSGVDRSVALLIRMMPFTFVWAVLAVAVAWAFDGSVGGGFFAFAVLSAATFVYLDRQERDYSRAGLERHRIDTAASLKAMELQHTHQLRREMMNKYLEHLEGRDQ